jgi:hypothetical protein
VSIALALVTGYDRMRRMYWDSVARRLAPLEYAWLATQFSSQSNAGSRAFPLNVTIDGGPQHADHGIFTHAVANLKKRKLYRGPLIRWKRDQNPDAAGKRPWLCVMHPEVFRRVSADVDPARTFPF